MFAELGTMGVASFVSNRLPLLNMPGDGLSAVREQGLAYSKAKPIARVEDGGRRASLIQETLDTPLSVAEVNRRVAQQAEGVGGARVA